VGLSAAPRRICWAAIFLGRRANLRRFPYYFLFRPLTTKSEFSSSAITIDIHLLDPDVDRSMAEYEECRLERSWISIGTSGGGGRDSESVQASQNLSSSRTTTYRMASLLGGDLNPILGFCFPLFSRRFPWEFPSGWKSAESSGSKIAANCCKSTYIVCVCVLKMFVAFRACGSRGEMRF